MSSPLEYETPENVRLAYRPAGLGTRFVAWVIDNIIINLLLFGIILLLLFVGAAAGTIVESWFRKLDNAMDGRARENPELVVMYAMGIMMLFWGFGSFVYFTLSELLMRGQTIGKRTAKIRVVKTEGFALDAGSILLRNLFRVADQLPPLWIVPLLTSRSQRFGDLAAGTIVVSDAVEELTSTRRRLSNRSVAESQYRFDYVKLGRLKPTDFNAVEQLLDRWAKLPLAQQHQVGARIITALCGKMGIDEPTLTERQRFLEDLLCAEFRRQDRQL